MVASECNRLRDLFIYMITEQVNEIATSTCLTEQLSKEEKQPEWLRASATAFVTYLST